MENKGKINPLGYRDLLADYMDKLKTRKLVALFDVYGPAHDDIMMEYAQKDQRQADAIEMCVNHFKEMCDIEDWYNEL